VPRSLRVWPRVRRGAVDPIVEADDRDCPQVEGVVGAGYPVEIDPHLEVLGEGLAPRPPTSAVRGGEDEVGDVVTELGRPGRQQEALILTVAGGGKTVTLPLGSGNATWRLGRLVYGSWRPRSTRRLAAVSRQSSRNGSPTGRVMSAVAVSSASTMPQEPW